MTALGFYIIGAVNVVTAIAMSWDAWNGDASGLSNVQLHFGIGLAMLWMGDRA